ncbi:MAG: tetratricopeptide repeat protein [Burkholderiaceae bacterium]
MKKTWASFVTGVTLSLLVASPAWAQLFSDDEARKAIIELRARIASLEKQSESLVTENSTLKSRVDGMAKSQLDMVSEMGQLRSELQNVLGSLETLTHTVTVDQGTLVSGIEQQIQSISERLARFEPQSFDIDNQTVLVDAKEKSAFEAAQGLHASGATEAAAAAFDEFSRRFPESALRPWALNFEGAAHYLRKNYKASIAALSELYRKYPRHTRVPESLLTLAASQAESGQTRAARNTLNLLLKQFPNSSQAATAKKRLAALGPSKN